MGIVGFTGEVPCREDVILAKLVPHGAGSGARVLGLGAAEVPQEAIHGGRGLGSTEPGGSLDVHFKIDSPRR